MADDVSCTAADRAVVCEGGAWREVACRGPRGCGRSAGGRSEGDHCDDTLAAEGDPCPATPAIDYACTADHAAALTCSRGRFSLWRHCRGQRACAIDADHRLECDTTLGAPGDPCEKVGAYACAADRQAMLQCRDGSLAVAADCRGPLACRFDRDKHQVECDDGIARAGDRCETAGRVACGEDRRSELVCGGDAGPLLTYEKKRLCQRGGCRVEGADLFCD